MSEILGPEEEGAQDRAARRSGEARFAAMVEVFGHRPGVTHAQPDSGLFGHLTIKVDEKIFAMVSTAGRLVVRLRGARVDELVTGGAGQYFSRGGRPMKEWLAVAPESEDEWLQLASEALQFVRGLK